MIKMINKYLILLIALLQIGVLKNVKAQWEQSQIINKGFVYAVDARDDKIAVLCNGFNDSLKTFFYSKNEGENWISHNLNVYSPTVLKITDNNLFLGYGIEGGGILRSNDNGETWISLSSLPIEGVLDIEALNGIIYSSMASDYNWVGVWKSEDNGDNWKKSWGGCLESVANLCLTTIDSLILVGTYEGGIYSSKYFLDDWISKNNGLPEKPIIHTLLSFNNTLYAAVQYVINDDHKYRIYYSKDLGENWNEMNKEFSSFPLFNNIMVTDGENIFLLTSSGIEMLNVSNDSWMNIQYNLPHDRIKSIAISRNKIIVGIYSEGLWEISTETLKSLTSTQQTKIFPKSYILEQNFPNPFNPSTRIEFYIPKTSRVVIEIYNILGRKVSTLINSELPLGNHDIVFDGRQLSSGIYFYSLITDDYKQTKKMLLIK